MEVFLPKNKIKKMDPNSHGDPHQSVSMCHITSCLPVQNVVARGFWVIHSDFNASCRNSRLCFHHQAFTSPHTRRANHIISISFYFICSLLPFPRLLSDGFFT